MCAMRFRRERTTATFLPDIFIGLGLSPFDVAILGAIWFYLNVVGAQLTSIIYKFCSPYTGLVVLLGVILILQLTTFGIVLADLGKYLCVFAMLVTTFVAAPAQAVACV